MLIGDCIREIRYVSISSLRISVNGTSEWRKRNACVWLSCVSASRKVMSSGSFSRV